MRPGASGAERWLPHAILATTFVVVAPAMAVWAVLPPGRSWLLLASVPLGMALSVAAATAGAAIWKRAPASRDLIFADLMLWGWLRRYRAERRLSQASKVLGSIEALERLSSLLEARDSYTHGHSQRVTRHAERIAKGMGLSSAEVAKIRTAAALHDVGKIHTPREILNKPGRLTESESDVIKRHPGDGADMVAPIGDPELTAMIRHHHERLDGKGYPDGLAGHAIPVGARIIAVADTFDAITSSRSYRGARSHKRALDILSREAGRQLDADAVAAFRGYYADRRWVAGWALVSQLPQRAFAWIGSGSIGSGAAVGATALVTGLGTPVAPIVSTPPERGSSGGAALVSTASPGAAEARSARREAARRPARSPARRAPARRRTRPPLAAPRGGGGTPPSSGGSPPSSAPPSREPGATPVPTPAPPPPDRLPEPVGSLVPDVEVPHVELPPIELPVDARELPRVEVPPVELPKVEVPKVELPAHPIG